MMYIFNWYANCVRFLVSRHPRRNGVILCAALLAGCVTSNGTINNSQPNSANQMVMIGVPLLLGGFGSAVPVSHEYMLTAKHVAQLSWDLDVIYHPYCDLALIRRPSQQVPTWGLIYPDQPVTHQGHSLLGTSISGNGKYLQDVIDTNTDCLYSLSDAPVMSGMSGGPVFNARGEIAGITVAIVQNPEDLRNLRPAERYSQFVPSTLIFDWLHALGIRAESASQDLAAIQVAEYVTALNRHQRPTQQPRRQSTQTTPTSAPSSSGQSTLVANRPAPGLDNTRASSPLGRYRTPVKAAYPAAGAPGNSRGGDENGLTSDDDEGALTAQKRDWLKPRTLLDQSGFNSSY